MDELLERKREGRFEAENAEGSAVELDVFERGLVRSVIGGDGVHSAVNETRDQSLAVFAGR